MSRIWKVLTRKKAIDPVTAEETRLSRVLNIFDLTALGVGSTLGVGVYVLAGQVAKTTAGPSVVLSFLIAAIASVFAGLCYAEFGARAPRAGSAYIYSYVCVGEFIAFVIGWNLILEYVIGSASVARGLSVYLDTLINNTLQDTFKEIAPINVPYLASYFDFFSLGISVLLAIALAFGVKESSMANNIVTSLNIIVILFIVIAGALKADPANWHVSPNPTNSTIGEGGFFPFGVEGMIKGAATCFYGFVGFDCIATTGEEVKNPRKAIPVSIVVSLLIIFLAYFGVATVLTLMIPYYEQDFNAPIPRAFEAMGWEVAKWIVAIGALLGLSASLFGAMFPLPRIIYAMGSDGLIFKFLAKVHPKFQSPVIGTILAGILTGLMAALFDLSQLVNMMSIGTLQAYTIVAASVLLLRYKEEVKKVYIPIKTSSDTESVSSESSVEEKYNDDTIRQNFDGPSTSDEQELIGSNSSSFSRSLKYIINCSIKEPTSITENIVAVEVLLYCVLCIGIGLCAIYLKTDIANGETWAIVLVSIIVGLTVIVLISLASQPKSRKELSFKVPLVPFIPALSILVNIYLMLMLDYMTWVRFAVWMALGIPMYYICACRQKPPCNPQNGTNYATNITNGHTKLSNGISNAVFVHTETNGQQTKSSKKKPAAPPPPTVVEQTETIEVQQEAAIAQLDEILEKETVIAQLDDVLNDETHRINDRKSSAGTVSNMSAVACSEDIVADVHCANVVTPVADSKTFPFPTVCDIPANLVETNNPSVEGQKSNEPLIDDSEKISSDATENNNNEGSSPLVPEEEQLPLEVVDKDIEAAQKAPTSEETKQKEDMSESLSENTMNENKEITQKSLEIIPPPLPTTTYKDESIVSSPIPSEESLKTVTLRHVKKQIKQIEPTDNQNTSNDNLKVGSQEYKNFIKHLDNKLNRITVVPFYVPPRKDFVQPAPFVPNENVIEESIDQEDAKEKLKHFYAKRNVLETFNPSESMAENPNRVLQGSKSMDESLLGVNNASNITNENLDISSKDSEPIKPSSGPAKSSSDPILEDHKLKMASVFNSMKLKKLESKSEGHLNRRLSKTVGSNFLKENDIENHKQKMSDIFKSITRLRNESFKKEKSNEKIE